MKSNQRRDKLRASRNRRWTMYIVGGCVLLGYFAYSFFFDTLGFMNYLNMKRTQAQMIGEIKAIGEKNAGLRKEVEAVKHDPATLETLARERLGMVQQGETIFLFVPEPEKRR